MAAIPYNLLERLRLLVSKHNGRVLGEEYGADITVTLQFPVDTFGVFEADLQELSAGKIKAEVIESREEIVKI
jgi:putative IMPACT (imprinted ancient) family translation regulator